MPSLVVGSVTIPVAPSGIDRPRLDLVDRSRAFDGTYRASATGNAKREWNFSTPPIARERADFYEQLLGTVTAQTCSGDILGGGGNHLLWSEDFSNAVWGKTSMTAAGGVADPFGGTLAYTLTATGASAVIQQNLSASTNIQRVNSIWLRRRTGTGTVGVLDPPNSVFTTQTLTSTYQRFSVVGAVNTGRNHGVQIVIPGDEVDAFGAQLEDGIIVGAYQRTTTAAVASSISLSCCSEVTGWTPVRTSDGHRVVLSFALHEA